MFAWVEVAEIFILFSTFAVVFIYSKGGVYGCLYIINCRENSYALLMFAFLCCFSGKMNRARAIF